MLRPAGFFPEPFDANRKSTGHIVTHTDTAAFPLAPRQFTAII